ncbi:stage II sporulation protein D [Cohnella abietis]|uniref:Sporulation stage II protein D amidase enhancer LytB N-terminal domain-containing protein n=1 Tax=Cohnella abietis TaxID=2507935 RepID=A0A3T1DE78_9BACL|nr:stage II sporulation protein D [Cohnella abietis]BBI36205.1 hypothetical protein KCTCHS21_56040 [Cohnella abietis]
MKQRRKGGEWPASRNRLIADRKGNVIKAAKETGGLNLWYPFTFGVIAACLIWLIVHGGSLGNDSIEPTSIGHKQFNQLYQFDGNVDMTNEGNALKTMQGGSSTNIIEPLIETDGDSSNSALNSDIVNNQQPTVRVYLTRSGTIEKVPLEVYVKGVVAAEMPLDFQPAALEAQALAARTYIIRRLWLNDRSGVTVKEADVMDTEVNQVYRSLSEMEQLRIDNEVGWQKVDKAVSRTAGQVIVYEDQPIEALFFSTSNGYTENSEEVFAAARPYLRSVASPWDKEGSPRAQETVEISLKDFYDKLDLKSITASSSLSAKKSIRIIEWTKGRRVKQMLVGNKKFTGEEIRHRLGLRSAAFDMDISKGKIILTTYGSGHGVGMSQWGAEEMAKSGKTARQIVEHYYSGIRLEEVSKLVKSSE